MQQRSFVLVHEYRPRYLNGTVFGEHHPHDTFSDFFKDTRFSLYMVFYDSSSASCLETRNRVHGMTTIQSPAFTKLTAYDKFQEAILSTARIHENGDYHMRLSLISPLSLQIDLTLLHKFDE